MSDNSSKPIRTPEQKRFRLNLWMFPLGTLGRDFLFNFFNGYLLTFILLTKKLSAAQFGSITAIIVAARIFDALNDPIVGGVVENTRTKWGKYKPWQLIGAISTGVVISLLFNLPLDGWAFIGFLAISYFLFSITFSFNDISYWGMMPTLTSDPYKRNVLTSTAQIFAGLGGGLCAFVIPVFTTGNVGTAVFNSVPRAFGVISIFASVLMIAFQFFTLFGVQEPKFALPAKAERLKFKDIFRVILKNDQLMVAAVCLLLTNIGTNAFTGGLSTMYIYFEFGYDGMLTVLFTALSGLAGTLFTLLFPILCKKWGRATILYFSGALVIFGYLSLMFVGLFVPNFGAFDVTLFGFEFHLSAKFMILVFANGWTGMGGFYMIQTINMANSVEYNELRTGKREESLIFSLRPLTNKMGSAIAQGIVSLVYIIAGVLVFTNQISAIENAYNTHASLTAEEGAQKLQEIKNVLQSVPDSNKKILLICMCVIPVVFITVSLLLHKKLFKLDEQKMAEINAELIDRRGQL